VQRAGQDGRARDEAGAADISSRAAAAFPVAPPNRDRYGRCAACRDNRWPAAGPPFRRGPAAALLRR